MDSTDTSDFASTERRPEKKSEFTIRILVLVLGCLVMMSSYYCTDNPAALHDPLERHFQSQYGSKEFERYFNLMYSLYSLPNIILPLVGGVLIDRVGYGWMNLFFMGCLLLGHILFAVGVDQRDMWILLAGRTVFGFGGECILVGLSSMLTDWFGGSGEFALIMGIKMSVARLGSVFNNIGSSAFYQKQGMSFAVWFGMILLGFSTIFLIILLLIDTWAKKRIAMNIKYNEELDRAETLEALETPGSPTPRRSRPASMVVKKGAFRIQEVTDFSFLYWLLLITCVLLYGAVVPFNHISGALIIHKFLCHGTCNDTKQKWAEKRASFLMGIPFISTCVLSPLIGLFVDKMGGNSIMFIVSGALLCGVHIMMAASENYDVLIIALVFLGLGYTIYASSIWPSVPTTLKPHQVGTGYGLMTSAQNIGLTIFPLIVAEIRGETGGYTWVEVFHAILGGMGTLTAIYTLFYDDKNNSLLRMSADERNEYLSEQQAILDSQTQSSNNEDDEDATIEDQLNTLAPVEVDYDNTTLVSR